MSDLRFPIQGGLSVTWAAAEEAYRGYARLYGTYQSLARLAERGGFGLFEFVCLVTASRAATQEKARVAINGWPPDRDVTSILATADIRSEA